MQEAKYTPGPWHLSDDSKTITNGKTAGEWRAVCDLRGKIDDPGDPAWHNASLILSAPELLEALEEASEFVDRHSEDWYRAGQVLLAKCRAAIAKATGSTAA